ncbi:MAG: hypothetical protein K0R29_2729, partial [Pseudobdellovibrio sp.]|nr:hypothetical protein [Pseudobdellovibrio sp.]
MALKLFSFLFLFFLQFSVSVYAHNSQAQETIATVAGAVDLEQKQVCASVRTLNSGGTLQNDVCEPYWPKTQSIVITAPRDSSTAASGDDSAPEEGTGSNSSISEVAVPTWADQIRENPDSVDKSSDNYDGDLSPAQMAERGQTMASRSELQQMEALFARTKTNTVQRCCGSNRECATAFRAVRLQFCTNPRASTHPNEPDRCTGRDSGIFTVTPDEIYMSWWHLRISRLPESQREAAREAAIREHPQLRNKLGLIAPGMVSISRYDRANDDGSTLWTFRHELGHACSHIRRQIATRNGSPLNA